MRSLSFLSLTLLVLVSACSSDDNGGGNEDDGKGDGDVQIQPVSGEARITGTVFALPDSAQSAAAAPGAAVRASVDRNNDGTIDDTEAVSVTADDNGAYAVTIATASGQNVVLQFRAAGYVTNYRTIRAGAGSSAKIDVSLAAVAQLTCADARCATSDNTLAVHGLDPSLSAAGRTFNPVTQAGQFPGRFGDDQGNLLLSGVFSHVELTGSDGGTVDTLATPATLRMQVPRETWAIVVDITPGNDRIDVPLYAFDAASGEWTRQGQGALEDGNGAVIAESGLASIRDGSFAGVVVARGEVNHFSYWNIDWPITSHGCLTFTVEDASGHAVPSAIVSINGTTYTGGSDAQALDASGRACVDVMRSEAPGEDVDNDGITGESQSVRARVVVDGVAYEGGSFTIGTGAGSCGGSCTDIGVLTVSDASKLSATVCEVTGTVRDIAGNAIADAFIYSFDELLDQTIAFNLCQSGDCFVATSAADGSFTIRTVVEQNVTVTGFAATETSDATKVRYGTRTSDHCPDAPVTVTLSQGYDLQTLTISESGGVISWTPNAGMYLLAVNGPDDALKWGVAASETGSFSGPVTYGVVPADGVEFAPAVGEVTSGDSITVHGVGTTVDGFSVTYIGELVVP